MSASQLPQLVVTTWALSSLAIWLKRSKRLGVVVVGRLVDDEGGRGRIDGRQLGVEGRLAPARRRPTGPAVDEHVADRVGQAVAGLEGAEVALRYCSNSTMAMVWPRPVRPWPNSWSSPKMLDICVEV